VRPSAVIVDSVQTVRSQTLESAAGSLSQVREVAGRLLEMAKREAVSVWLIGHVTKDGSLAGPKALEHIVDTVVYFEGDRHHAHRILRATKNRFGPTDEVGVFEMRSEGLVPVENPSALFLAERPPHATGCLVVATLEGSRPILLEVQSLVTSTGAAVPRRVANGLDFQRVAMLLAVLEKRLGLRLGSADVFLNVVGGLEIREPAADLGVLAAVLSSVRNFPVDSSARWGWEARCGRSRRPRNACRSCAGSGSAGRSSRGPRWRACPRGLDWSWLGCPMSWSWPNSSRRGVPAGKMRFDCMGRVWFNPQKYVVLR
jgi:DNA repair protein RadA/Sms